MRSIDPPSAEQCFHEYRPIDTGGQLACIHCNARYRQEQVSSKTDLAIRALRVIQQHGRNDAIGKTLMLMEAEQALYAIEMADRRGEP